jgi:hypothetical protein
MRLRLSRLLGAAGARPPVAQAAALPRLRPAPASAAAAGAARFGWLAAVPLLLPTSWLSTRGLHGTTAASTGARGRPAARGAVLVKVGGGKYLVVDRAGLVRMKSGALLKALEQDKAFATKLAGVALDECAVFVCASTSKKAPTAGEEAAARELEGAETLGDLAAGLAGASPGAGTPNLFVRVALPPRPGSTWTAVGEDGECALAAVHQPGATRVRPACNAAP